MPYLHHPAIQSLLLPALLAWAGIALLRALPAGASRRWAPLGAVLALLATLAVLPGFGWPATAAAYKLPWVVLAGLALAAVLRARELGDGRGGPWAQWLVATLCWSAAVVWLGGGHSTLLAAALTTLAGAAALALLAWGDGPAQAGQGRVVAGGPVPQSADPGGAGVAAALVVAALGLAALAGSGGSLLLAQLALALATVSAVLGLWVWLRPDAGLGVPAAVRMPLGLAWLALASTLHQLTGVGAARLVLLVLALCVPLLLTRTGWMARRPRWAPLVAAALAAVPVALALGWQLSAGGLPADTPRNADDGPYYTPRWQ